MYLLNKQGIIFIITDLLATVNYIRNKIWAKKYLHGIKFEREKMLQESQVRSGATWNLEVRFAIFI